MRLVEVRIVALKQICQNHRRQKNPSKQVIQPPEALKEVAAKLKTMSKPLEALIN